MAVDPYAWALARTRLAFPRHRPHADRRRCFCHSAPGVRLGCTHAGSTCISTTRVFHARLAASATFGGEAGRAPAPCGRDWPRHSHVRRSHAAATGIAGPEL